MIFNIKRMRELTFSGTERLAVRNMASAIPWAYHGYKEGKAHIKIKGRENHVNKAH